jgi:Tfp pilus assembly protein PilF
MAIVQVLEETVMNPAIKSLLLAVALALSVVPAVDARDTPTMMSTSVVERMDAARAAIQARDWRTAIAELDAVVENEPGDADAHSLLGYSHRKQASPDLAKAFEHYRRALQIDPRHKGAHEYIGEAYLMDNQPAEAEKHLAELARLCGNQGCEEYVDLAEAIKAYKEKPPR